MLYKSFANNKAVQFETIVPWPHNGRRSIPWALGTSRRRRSTTTRPPTRRLTQPQTPIRRHRILRRGEAKASRFMFSF